MKIYFWDTLCYSHLKLLQKELKPLNLMSSVWKQYIFMLSVQSLQCNHITTHSHKKLRNIKL